MSITELRQLEGVRAFLREVERRDEELDACSKLHDAAFKGNQEVVKLTLDLLKDDEETFDINEPHPIDGRTYLHSAAMGVPSTMAEYLVRKWGASVDSRDNRGRTPLLVAAIHGSTRVITRLIALGADEHAVDNDGVGALMHAAQGGHIKAVLFLHQLGISVSRHANDGRTALHVAAFTGQTSNIARECMVEKLRDIGADLNTVTLNGFAPLHYAALGNQSAIIVKLYNLGADLNWQDVNGLTPLMIAAEYGNLKSVQVLIQLGADTRKVDSRGYSALHFASAKNRIPVVKYLFGKIPPLSSRATLATHLKEIAEWSTKRGYTAMALASQKRHHKMVELFSMALLYSEVPTMVGHLLVIQLDIYGITLEHGGTLDLGRVKLMEYLKKIFGLKNCELPMY